MNAILAPWRGRLLAVGIVVLSAAMTYANYDFALRAPGGAAFLPGWMAARVWVVDGRSPYDLSVGQEAQSLLYGRPARPGGGEDPLYFTAPLPAIVLYMPFALAPYELARALWMTLLELSLPALALLGFRLAGWRPPPLLALAILVFSIGWYHGVVSIVSGDTAAVEGLLLAGALWAIAGRHDGLAGVLLAASAIRPEIVFLLLPLIAVWSAHVRRWALLLSLVLSLAAAVGLSLLLEPGWPLPWFWRLLDTQGSVGFPSAVSAVSAGFGRWETPVAWIVSGLMMGYGIWEFWRSYRKGSRALIWAVQIVAAISLWVGPQRSTAACVVLIPALALVWGAWGERRAPRSSWVIGGTMLVLSAGTWALYLATARQAVESPWLLFPVPLITLIGLWWIRWWATRGALPTLDTG